MNTAKIFAGILMILTSYPSKFIIDHTGQIITKTDNSEMTLEAFEMFISELK